MIKKIFFILLTLLVTVSPIFGKTQDVDILKSRNSKSATMNGKKYHYDIENSIYIGKFNGVQSYIAFIKPQNKPNKTFVGYFNPISGDKIINAYNGLLNAFKDNENFIQMNDARWISSYTDIDFNNVKNCHYPIQHGVKDSMNMYIVDGTSMQAIAGSKSCVYIRQTRDDVNAAFYPVPNIKQLPEKFTAIHLCPRNKVVSGTFYKIWGLTKK